MPYTKCPLCGAISHINVSADWYEKYHPTLLRGSLIPGRCFDCWQEVKTGDGVVIREPSVTNRSIQSGEQGVVEGILTEEDGSLYLVKMASGKECYFIRAEFRKQRENEK